MGIKSRKEVKKADSKEKPKILQHVLYEVNVLATAILEHPKKLNKEWNSKKFWSQEVSQKAINVTFRTVANFVYKRDKEQLKEDDIVLETFGEDSEQCLEEYKNVFDGINKFGTHLTWERIKSPREKENQPIATKKFKKMAANLVETVAKKIYKIIKNNKIKSHKQLCEYLDRLKYELEELKKHKYLNDKTIIRKVEVHQGFLVISNEKN